MAVHGREVHRRHALPRVRHVGARPDEHVRDVRVAVLRRHEQRCAAGVVGGEVDLLLAAVGEERLDHVDAPLLSCDGDGERGRARLEQRVAFELEQLLHHLEVARLRRRHERGDAARAARCVDEELRLLHPLELPPEHVDVATARDLQNRLGRCGRGERVRVVVLGESEVVVRLGRLERAERGRVLVDHGHVKGVLAEAIEQVDVGALEPEHLADAWRARLRGDHERGVGVPVRVEGRDLGLEQQLDEPRLPLARRLQQQRADPRSRL
mmetsp:Transcript_73175/g.219744  ORF Transcript_73175/g.219744 Transcript_73175/m.219744 type:complete len:268 (-) Transcript_73175:647-1450(-)